MLEWSEFARRLGRELAGLERDTILIVRERDESRHYVQAMREPDRLYAEAVSNNFLEGPLLLTLADEEVMSEAGWRPPAEPAPRNWWTELPDFGTPGGMLAVTEVDFSRLADVMVTALRDVQGVRRPSDLVYESFHRHGTGLIELLDFGIEVADPARVNKRRSASGGPSGDLPGPPAGGATGAVGAVGAAGVPPAGADPLPAGTPPAGNRMPPQDPATPDADRLEPRLAEAKANGDNTTYFRLLANADLVLPATAPAVEDPDRAELPTIAIGGDTYVTVFTSPAALARTGDRNPGLYRRTSFAQLALGWPDPAWRLAINWGLPSEVLLDSSVVPRLQAGPEAAAAAAQEAPNPYGTVDPNALAGPNPVAGGSTHGLNGSPAGVNGPPPGAGGPQHDDSHTAIDPFTAADLRAALEAGAPGGPAAPAETGPAAAGAESPAPAPPPPDPRAPNPLASDPLTPAPLPQRPRAPEPPAPEPPAREIPAAEIPAPQQSIEPEPSRPGPVLPPAPPEHVQDGRVRPEPPAREIPAAEVPAPQQNIEPEPSRPEPALPPAQPEHVQEERVRPEPPAREIPATEVPAPQQNVEPEPSRPEPVLPLAQPEPVPPEHVQDGRVRAESGQAEPLRPKDVQPDRGREEAAAAPLGAPTNRRPAVTEQQSPGVPIRLPHGARLWHWAGEGEQTPLAVYDAVGGVWAPVRADAVPAPGTE
ncbi:TY-Chap domain-containing protein [Actinomadura welshii]